MHSHMQCKKNHGHLVRPDKVKVCFAETALKRQAEGVCVSLALALSLLLALLLCQSLSFSLSPRALSPPHAPRAHALSHCHDTCTLTLSHTNNRPGADFGARRTIA